jgi:hypothetical protein
MKHAVAITETLSSRKAGPAPVAITRSSWSCLAPVGDANPQQGLILAGRLAGTTERDFGRNYPVIYRGAGL